MKKVSKIAIGTLLIAGLSTGVVNAKTNQVAKDIMNYQKNNESFIGSILDKAYEQIIESQTYSSTGLTTTEDANGNLTITGYTGSSTNVEIPKTIDGKKVTLIGNKAFQNNKTIEKLKISADITAIGEFAFCDCTSLEEVEFPESLVIINGFAFLGDPIKELNIPNNVLIIKTFAFQDMKASEVVLPESLQQLHSSAFRSSDNLKTVKVYNKDLIFDADYPNGNDNSTIFEYCPEDLVLYGYKGSTTEAYATKNNITFRELESEVLPTGISLNKSSMSLDVGKTEKLVATITPENATNKTVTWESLNTEVATVDNSGTVTGVSEGNATIQATTSNGKKAICTVVVNKVDDKSIYFVLNHTEGTVFHIASGDEKDVMIGTTEIPNSEIENITCTSSDTSIMTVGDINVSDKTFNVKALKEGKVTLTISLTYNGVTYKDTYEINVKEKYEDYYTYEISGDKEVSIGKTANLKAKQKIIDAVLPEEDKTEDSTWKSSDETILTVNNNGVVTGVKEGTATVTATYNNGEAELSAEYEVTVKENVGKVTKVEINKKPSRTEYNVGDKINIDDGELIVTYEDGSTRIISMGNEDVKVEGFDTSKVGEIEVTLTYEGQSVVLNFKVVEKEEEKGDGDDKGKEEEEVIEEKIDTGDNILITIGALVISAIAIIAATIGIKGKKKKGEDQEIK